MSRVIGGAISGQVITCAPKSGWADPEVGNLVVRDTTGNHYVDECASGELPDGIIVAMDPSKTVLSVELFEPGMVAVLPYTGTIARGDKIAANGTLKSGTTEGVVKRDNALGRGRVVAKDRLSGYVDVRFTEDGATGSSLGETAGASTAAAGSTTADAGVLPAATARVYPTTAADDTKGVRVHADDKVTGRMLFIGNGVSNKILKVYPPSGGSINGAAADAAFSSASGKGVILYCLDATANTWLAW